MTQTKKQGAAADRAACARFAREQRARFPELSGNWTRREWYMQIRIATANRLARMTRSRGSWAAVRSEADKAQERELARMPNGGFVHG